MERGEQIHRARIKNRYNILRYSDSCSRLRGESGRFYSGIPGSVRRNMGIPLQIAEPTGRYRRDLRRFTYRDKAPVPCSRDWGHDATVIIGEVAEEEHERVHGDNWPHDDERWPKSCEHCGYEFFEADEWQRNDNMIYRLPDGTEFTTWGSDIGKAPPGSMIRMPWADEHFGRGESWMVILPDGGTWITTQSATGGGYWEVTGTPPLIDVSPSIFHNQPHGWHGFIQHGELIPA
jgi:hypothetical protein